MIIHMTSIRSWTFVVLFLSSVFIPAAESAEISGTYLNHGVSQYSEFIQLAEIFWPEDHTLFGDRTEQVRLRLTSERLEIEAISNGSVTRRRLLISPDDFTVTESQLKLKSHFGKAPVRSCLDAGGVQLQEQTLVFSENSLAYQEELHEATVLCCFLPIPSVSKYYHKVSFDRIN